MRRVRSVNQFSRERRLKVFEETIDMIMLQYHALYEQNRDRIEEEDFDKTKERKKMNEYVKAIVILFQNKDSRL